MLLGIVTFLKTPCRRITTHQYNSISSNGSEVWKKLCDGANWANLTDWPNIDFVFRKNLIRPNDVVKWN